MLRVRVATNSNTIVAVPRVTNSGTSSLGPNDSASQVQHEQDFATNKAVRDLLESVEASPIRPHFLPSSILWTYGDCEKDMVICTQSNKSRPRMLLAIRNPDGTPVSRTDFNDIKRSADLRAERLAELLDKDPRSAAYAGDPSVRTKTLINTYFRAEFLQAMLDLEAERKILRLCGNHWKADYMISQAFRRLNLNKAKKAEANRASAAPSNSDPSDVGDSQPWESIAQPIKAAKRALELTPGPKLPLASQAQKHSKDDIRQKAARAPGYSNRESSTQRPNTLTSGTCEQWTALNHARLFPHSLAAPMTPVWNQRQRASALNEMVRPLLTFTYDLLT